MSFRVTVVSPAGVQRVVAFQAVDLALAFVAAEGKTAPPLTLLYLTESRNGTSRPRARWIVTHRGLVRGARYQ